MDQSPLPEERQEASFAEEVTATEPDAAGLPAPPKPLPLPMPLPLPVIILEGMPCRVWLCSCWGDANSGGDKADDGQPAHARDDVVIGAAPIEDDLTKERPPSCCGEQAIPPPKKDEVGEAPPAEKGQWAVAVVLAGPIGVKMLADMAEHLKGRGNMESS